MITRLYGCLNARLGNPLCCWPGKGEVPSGLCLSRLCFPQHNTSNCLTKKVHETGSLSHLRKVLETGGKATLRYGIAMASCSLAKKTTLPLTMKKKQVVTKQLALEYRQSGHGSISARMRILGSKSRKSPLAEMDTERNRICLHVLKMGSKPVVGLSHPGSSRNKIFHPPAFRKEVKNPL